MYDKLFDSDNPFWRAMTRLFDAVELNILWLICCIPIVTIGPATTAFYSAMMKLVRGEETYVYKDFFRSLKKDFKQSIVPGILLTLVGAFLAFDLYLAWHSEQHTRAFLFVFFSILLLAWSFVTLYTFPLIALFENSMKNTLMLAFTLSIRHIFTTILMLLCTVAALWVIHLIPGLVFLAFGVLVEFESVMLLSVFRPFLPKEEEETDEFEDCE